jgi:hypothetical protein
LVQNLLGANLLGESLVNSLFFILPSDRNRVARERDVTIQGLTTIQSNFGPKDTMNRLEATVQTNGMTVFARIDHAAGATAVGLSLRPTEVLIFW